MKVVMLKDVKGVGQRGTVVEVADGFALQSLIPQGKAMQGTPDKVAQVQQRIAQEKATTDALADKLKRDIKKLEGTSFTITAKASDKGHLFKGIKKDEVAQKLAVPASAISGLDDVTRATGEYKLKLSAHDVHATVILTIKAE